MIGCALLAAAVFTLDLFIKNHIEKTRTEGETELSRGGLVVFHKYHNRGAFLNLGEKKRELMTIVSLILTLALTVVFLTTFTCRGRYPDGSSKRNESIVSCRHKRISCPYGDVAFRYIR